MAARIMLRKWQPNRMDAAGENVVAFRSSEIRHLRASREAVRRDRVWFRKNPHRSWRIRAFMPDELKALTAEPTATLCYCDRSDGSISRIALAAHDMRPDILPDDDIFLGALWFYATDLLKSGSARSTIDPLAHLLMLNMSGHRFGGAA
jgi:hypothetical protein